MDQYQSKADPNDPNARFPFEAYDPYLTQDALVKDLREMEETIAIMASKLTDFRLSNGFCTIPKEAKRCITSITSGLFKMQAAFRKTRDVFLNATMKSQKIKKDTSVYRY